ncbi:hypothetical protein SAMN05421770_10966 [Granulicella rosea]|uniref:Uncharacterized protein n=2 Tax=Granulicella rosea TaxID=474952 RepID=A0A239M4G9_9BACT|nr:hypothetical protein SAMN05421770_10966 [Granulicella rosea]
MLKAGPALKVTLYLNDDTGSEHGFLHMELLAFLEHRGIAGASAVRPYAGFGSHHRLHVAGGGDVRGEHLPIILSFIDDVDKVEALLPELLERVTDGLVEAHPTQILKSALGVSRVIV